MVRHLVRHVVKQGHYQDFLKAAGALNDAAVSAGLPRYRFWASQFGDFNEVWAEGEYESVAAHLSTLAANRDNAAWIQAFREFLSHLVDGEQHDYILEEEILG